MHPPWREGRTLSRWLRRSCPKSRKCNIISQNSSSMKPLQGSQGWVQSRGWLLHWTPICPDLPTFIEVFNIRSTDTSIKSLPFDCWLQQSAPVRRLPNMANLVKIVVATMMMMILRVMMMIWITSYDDDYFALTIPSTSSPSDFSCSTAFSTLVAWQSTPISWHWSPQPKYPKIHHIIKKKTSKSPPSCCWASR